MPRLYDICRSQPIKIYLHVYHTRSAAFNRMHVSPVKHSDETCHKLESYQVSELQYPHLRPPLVFFFISQLIQIAPREC